MTIVYISIAIVAIALVVLIFYIIQTLKSAQGVVKQLGNTADAVEKQLQGITTETENLVKTTNRLAEDFESKSESLEGLFSTAEDLGKSTEQVSDSIQNITHTVSQEAERNAEQVARVVQWGNACIDLYDKWKQRRNKEENID
ncbi:DUF948 domain-containing protein [Natribacillus halophilus]|uniref:Uncharacterized protein YoxC, contains an MCP-like domain n=1 Tax=Natribacillus halophilus TaxID=549003 RepID=A0A1G8NFW9_9BACI|nr:DUF948 domain-containing protein [Natribacillus halophilus]SDI78976.1 Uncharacterized protein YoxC, contains an MCP-like domain [Natribacillus halophilus]